MADNKTGEELDKKVETPAPDPIADHSMSGPLLIAAIIMIGTLVWALYDEIWGQRPWKNYQAEFVDTYTAHLNKIKKNQASEETKLKENPDYQSLNAAYEDAKKSTADEVKDLSKQISLINQKLSDITERFQDTRAWIASKTYLIETASTESGKNSIRDDITDKRKQKVEVSLTNDNGVKEDKEFSFNELESMYNSWNDEKARLTTQLIAALRPQNEAKAKLDDFVKNNQIGLTPAQIDGLVNKMENFDFTIKQVNIAGTNVVDRCESCHLGVREPITLTKKDMGGEAAFVSHPQKELLEIHDVDRFGCSTCHGGNGRGTTSPTRGHGRYKHWLWPLYYKENVQSGCNQCHNKDRVTPMADVLNHGKDLFQTKGCAGCHRYEGFDRESDAISSSIQTIKQLELDYSERMRDIREAEKASESATSDEEAQALLKRVDALRQTASNLNLRKDQINAQAKYLLKDQKKIGPNLKEIKAKLRKEWMPVWISDPQAFRPGTKMPAFRLDEDEIKAISAFLWQSAIDPEKDGVRLASQPQGDAARGKELFKNTGCLACHSIDGNIIGMGDQPVGGTFAANLSRVGEKASYDYIVRWVHNPRERLLPYSPSLGRDLTPADYASKGVRFLFDDEHSKSPLDGNELQVQNMTVMPNFRLSDQDARDIATFLVSLKKGDPSYPDASYMDDQSLFARGQALTKAYGCAGCHEIRGLENEQKIGTELTQEGSKPIERLDFALLTEDAKAGLDPFTGGETARGSWYNHKGFFENKLRSPGIYDLGKVKTAADRLKMPNIYLTNDEITALTTFLLGSVATALPERIRYNPTGQQKQVQDGWWIVQKYNCAGCHNVLIGKDSTLMGEPMYQTAEGKEQLPPRLTSEGARVQPDWLLKFLRDPSLSNGGAALSSATVAAHLAGGSPPTAPPTVTPPSGANASQAAAPSGQTIALKPQPGRNENGVRKYLKVRMPTFNFSPNELQSLVNFFMGSATQPQPYIPDRLDPLTTEEQTIARSLFTSQAAPCLKCHMTGVPSHDIQATAPNFLIAPERLKPNWTERWILDPAFISPGTSMPSGLFTRDAAHDRWVFSGNLPPAAQAYDKDHAKLLVRYMFQMTPDEQRRLVGGGATGGGASAAPAASTTTGASSAVTKTGESRPVARAGNRTKRNTGP
jgi:mono/diheme cytochrome c family protein